ncbi:MAG: hypothetical protein ACTSWY_10380 [Promethearchaeota archaeon]
MFLEGDVATDSASFGIFDFEFYKSRNSYDSFNQINEKRGIIGHTMTFSESLQCPLYLYKNREKKAVMFWIDYSGGKYFLGPKIWKILY